MRFNEYKQKEEPHPTSRKSETGAIDRIEIYSAADRRSFSVEEAVAWLANPMTGSSYQVELFESPPPRSEWDRLDTGHRRLIESFIEGFRSEEHTSELQSLMRISYAVFCLKKKNETDDNMKSNESMANLTEYE